MFDSYEARRVLKAGVPDQVAQDVRAVLGVLKVAGSSLTHVSEF